MNQRSYPKQPKQLETGDWFFDGKYFEAYPEEELEKYHRGREKYLEERYRCQAERECFFLPAGKELNFD